MLKQVCHPHDFYQKNCQIPDSKILIFKITFFKSKSPEKFKFRTLFYFFH